MTTKKQKLVQRIYDITQHVGGARGELYNPWVSIKNNEWTEDQIIDNIGPALDRFMAAIDQAEQGLISLLQDLAAEDRL